MDDQEIRAEVVVVDDSRETLQLLCRMLYKNGYDVRPLADSQTAFASIKQNLPDIALLDISMSGVNGYELCHAIKSDPYTEHIPVIFISALDDTRNKVKAFQLGAIDYITKPFKFQEVLARLQVHLAQSKKTQELTDIIGLESLRHATASQASNETIQYIIHDLRNPLHVVALNLSLLKKHLAQSKYAESNADPEEQAQAIEQTEEYFDRINRNLAAISQLIGECVD